LSLTRRTAAWLLVALVVAAAWLRLRGLDALLPHWTYPDGYPLLGALERVRAGMVFDAQKTTVAQYPFLLPRVAALLPGPALAEAHGPVDLATALAGASEPWMKIRLASVLLSLLAVGCTYGIARRFLERGSVPARGRVRRDELLHVTFGPAQRPHAAAAGTVTLAVMAALHLRRRPTLAAQALAAACVGLAIGALQSGAATVLPWVAAWWLRDGRRSLGGASQPGRSASRSSRCACAGSIRTNSTAPRRRCSSPPTAACCRSRPQALPRRFQRPRIRGGRADAVLPRSGADRAGGRCRSDRDRARVRRTETFADEQRSDLWVVLAYVVPYVLVIGTYQHTFERFVMPLIPFVAIAAAWSTSRLARALARPSARSGPSPE
jgi:hypothetical protein